MHFEPHEETMTTRMGINEIDYKNEFTYLAAYSLIKQVQATGEVDKIVLERRNNRCAVRMGVRPIPL